MNHSAIWPNSQVMNVSLWGARMTENTSSLNRNATMPHSTVAMAIFIRKALNTSKCSQNDIPPILALSTPCPILSFDRIFIPYVKVVFHAFIEITHPFAQPFHQFGYLLVAEKQQNYQYDKNYLLCSYSKHHF